MTREDLAAQLADLKAMIPTGLDSAVIGVVERFGSGPVALVDRDRCVRIFVERYGMTEEDAEEHFDFNVGGAWVGLGTPAFCQLVEEPPW